MESRFKLMYRDISRSVTEKESVYVLHSPLGALSIAKFHYREDTGYVFLEVQDEHKKPRLIGFSEEQLATMPFEVVLPRATASIGFATNAASEND